MASHAHSRETQNGRIRVKKCGGPSPPPLGCSCPQAGPLVGANRRCSGVQFCLYPPPPPRVRGGEGGLKKQVKAKSPHCPTPSESSTVKPVGPEPSTLS